MSLHICFIHGKESGPWGNKGQLLSGIAHQLGYEYSALNYLTADNPDDPESRLQMLLEYLSETRIPEKELVLAGSSMGGYIAARATQHYPAVGLFLMAPALGIESYPSQWPEMNARERFIIHGLFDSVIPWSHSNDAAQKTDTPIHLLADDHRLSDSLNIIEEDFRSFLSRISQ